MKLFLVFCITCLVGVNSFAVKDAAAAQETLEEQLMAECEAELKTEPGKYTKSKDTFATFANPHTDDEKTCMVACAFRKFIGTQVAPELTGPSNKETLNNGLTKLIDEAYELGFGKEYTDYSHEDIAKQVKMCYDQESTECGFFKCVIVPDDKPILAVAAFYYFRVFMYPGVTV